MIRSMCEEMAVLTNCKTPGKLVKIQQFPFLIIKWP